MVSLDFLRRNASLLGFGLLLAFSSSFGQTFYVSLFSAEIRAAYGLGHGGFGLVYSTATLLSGLLIINLGRLIDHIDLRLYAALLCAGLAMACGLMATGRMVLLLGLAIFCLRLFGQGLLSHAATTTMARYFDAGVRGRAVSVAAIGFPIGEALLPSVAVAGIAVLGWRQTWGMTALFLAAIVLPLALFLLRGHGARHGALLARLRDAGDDSNASERQWTRREVLADRRFWLAMLAMLGPSFIVTGVFFHQVHIVAVKGWTLSWFAASFVVYALVQVAAVAATGALVDRIGGRRLAPFYLLPLVLGLVLLASLQTPLAAPLFMALSAITSGAGATLMSVLWAELYGVLHLGAIRALVFGFSVIASALSPATLGWLIDAGVSVDAIAWGCAAYAACGCVLVSRALGARRPARAPR